MKTFSQMLKKLFGFLLSCLAYQNLSSAEVGSVCLGCSELNFATGVSRNYQGSLEQIKNKLKSLDIITFFDPEVVENTDSRKLAQIIFKRLHNL